MTGTCVQHEPQHRAEWIVLLIVTAVGAGLRLGGSHAVSHYDEGVYVFWSLGVDYPAKEFFAPPLFPFLCGLANGIQEWSAGLVRASVSGLFGTAMVPLVWWVTRRWYGHKAAIAAATMAALSGFHVAFSRMMLTDASFSFWMVLSLGLAGEMFERCRASRAEVAGGRRSRASPWPWAVALGLAAGAAVNTKYNGFLALAFAAGPLGGLAACRSLRQSMNATRAIAAWGLAVAIAIMCYLPWFLHVEHKVGYATLVAHHRGYATGWASWPGNLWTQLFSHWYVADWPLRLGPAAGVVAAVVFGRMLRARGVAPSAVAGRAGWPELLVLIATAAAVGLLAGDAAAWLLGAIFAVARLRRHGAVAWLHAAWLVGLIVLTPLYRPYPRIMLPLVAGGWIAAGAIVAELLERTRAPAQSVARRVVCVAGLGLCAVAAAVAYLLLPQATADTRALATLEAATGELDGSLPRGQPVAAFVRPPVLYHLRTRPELARLADLDWLAAPDGRVRWTWLLVDHALVRDNAQSRERLEQAHGRLHPVTSVRYNPGRVVVLDDFGSASLQWDPRGGGEQADPYRLVLYRVTYPGTR